MYGGTKAPSLLPRYATGYIVHKEAVRHLFLDGFGSHLFELKKVVFPPLPFYVGIYKFTKVKSTHEFVKELEIFHFGENSFHRNDSKGKVAAYKAALKVNFQYTDYVDKDEEKYRNVCSMTTLNMWLKGNISTYGVKGSINNNPEPKEQDEEAARKTKETARRLAAGAKMLLAKEAQRDK